MIENGYKEVTMVSISFDISLRENPDAFQQVMPLPSAFFHSTMEIKNPSPLHLITQPCTPSTLSEILNTDDIG